MKSIWTKTAALPAFSVLEGHQQADVAVIGGGLAGMLTAAADGTARAEVPPADSNPGSRGRWPVCPGQSRRGRTLAAAGTGVVH